MRLKTILSAGLMAIGVMGCQAPAKAVTRQANPLTLPVVLLTAKGGDTVVLGPGTYSSVKLRPATYSPALIIDAKAATLTGLSLRQVEGLELRGGVYHLPPPTTQPKTGKTVYGSAIRIDEGRKIKISGASFVGIEGEDAFAEGFGLIVRTGSDIEVAGSQFSGLNKGVAMSWADGFRLTDNTFTGMRNDGMALGESRNGLIQGNTCRGTHRREHDHSDCIQLWSRPTSPPTADIVIRQNKMEGPTQGISLFNHKPNGVDDGGFDRILIEDNDVYVGFPNGIALIDGRESTVRNNRVRTYPGAEWRATLNLRGDIKRCGNTVAAGANKSQGITDPKC